ncbi:hypothetical protein SDC9_186064 [bioreactor metagenome]|uniref:Uncharacterized protein n=1 Tax=bioreactor metagenome TaxID=1076179 RepID=A0A645HIG7_9ZZZZ
MLATIAAYPKPPLILPTMMLAKSTSCLDNPPLLMISPESMKKGIAIRGKLFVPMTIACAMISGLKFPRKNIRTIEHKTKTIAIGMPNAKNRKSETKNTTIAILFLSSLFVFDQAAVIQNCILCNNPDNADCCECQRNRHISERNSCRSSQ